jgi:predicted alpha/beta-fold hydrolase
MKRNDFKPAWWLRNPHLQTLWPALVRRPAQDVVLERERVELPDGDFIDLDWVNRGSTTPIVLILHGLEGSIQSHYAKGMMKQIAAQGWRSVFMHFRGCSEEPNRMARSYHSGDTKDVTYIVNLLRKREATVPIAAVGFSLGGNVLLKWLGETGASNPLTAAAAISVPFELKKCAKRIQKGLSRGYQWYFLKCLQERLIHKHQYVPNIPIRPDVAFKKIKTMVEFDDQYTAPLNGFSDVEEYYAISSSRQYLLTIAVPTLILHAKDDPFMSETVIPDPEELSRHVRLEITDRGGHVGFVSGRYPWRPEYWLEYRVPEFFKDHL